MSKLFNMEDFDTSPDQTPPPATPEDVFVSVHQDIGEYSLDLDIATERLNTTSSELMLVTGISASMKSKKLASIDYFTSMENYRPVLESIAQNLGMKNRVPSLEDFRNPNGTQASHDIAMEGFFDYIKKLWDKIKDIFAAFFKKISVFFRRLFNAELELATYEEYIEGMVAKIKAKKMTVSDNKIVLDSKLPTLLANPGMETVDSDFILTVGEGKIRQLVQVANNTFQTNLSKLAKDELKDLHKAVKDLVDGALRMDRPVDEVAEDLYQIRVLSVAGLDQLFGYAVNDLRHVPDSVYDAVYHNFDKSELDDLRIHSLVDSNNFSESLPKNFNAYYVLSESGKLFVSASTESNGYTQNKLYPISNANNLVRFYDFYKKMSKELNLKRIDASISEFQDRIDDIIGLMKSRYVDLLEKLQKSKHAAKQGARLSSKEDAISALVNMFREMDRRTPNNVEINKLLFKTCAALGIDGSNLENVVRDRDAEASRKVVLEMIRDEEEFVKQVQTVLATSGHTDQQTYSSHEDLERIVKEYEAFQRFLLNYLNSLQVMLKEVSVNLAGTFTELRFELAKYIYNSAKLYVA